MMNVNFGSPVQPIISDAKLQATLSDNNRVHACEACRRSHLKCDQNKPCAKCSKKKNIECIRAKALESQPNPHPPVLKRHRSIIAPTSSQPAIPVQTPNIIERKEQEIQNHRNTSSERVTRSCDSCRHSHVSCDKATPCSRCADRSSPCIRSEAPHRASKKQRALSPPLPNTFVFEVDPRCPAPNGLPVPQKLEAIVDEVQDQLFPPSVLPSRSHSFNASYTPSQEVNPQLPPISSQPPVQYEELAYMFPFFDGETDPFAGVGSAPYMPSQEDTNNPSHQSQLVPLSPRQALIAEMVPLPEAIAAANFRNDRAPSPPTSVIRSERLRVSPDIRANIVANIRFLRDQIKNCNSYKTLAKKINIHKSVLYNMSKANSFDSAVMNKITQFFNVTFEALCSSDFRHSYQLPIKKPAQSVLGQAPEASDVESETTSF